MKLGNGYSTYIDFYATVGWGMVKVWSEVQESKFALDNGWIIEKVTVLGMEGNGGEFAVEVDGNPVATVSKVEFSTAEQKYPQKLEEGGDEEDSYGGD